MDRCVIRKGTAADVPGLFALLQEFVTERGLQEEFANTGSNFKRYFEEGLFKALIVEDTRGESSPPKHAGCLLYSVTYDYVVGTTIFFHCPFIRPEFRNADLERTLIQRAKEVSVEAGIDIMLTCVNGEEESIKRSWEAEGAINLTTSSTHHIDMWFMPRNEALMNGAEPTIKEGYNLHGASEAELDGIFDLLLGLSVEQELGDDFISTREEFLRNGRVIGNQQLYSAMLIEHVAIDDEMRQGTSKTVGCILVAMHYYALIGRTYFVQGFYISPDHRGRGLGKSLLLSALQKCQEQGADGFLLMILRGNTGSASLFRSLDAVNMSTSRHKMEWLTIKQ